MSGLGSVLKHWKRKQTFRRAEKRGLTSHHKLSAAAVCLLPSALFPPLASLINISEQSCGHAQRWNLTFKKNDKNCDIWVLWKERNDPQPAAMAWNQNIPPLFEQTSMGAIMFWFALSISTDINTRGSNLTREMKRAGGLPGEPAISQRSCTSPEHYVIQIPWSMRGESPRQRRAN